ncbi:bifunctional phosphopantothenoylcysteine decarboxylase/phosphopantothenate--cysteine ligase CoaBC [Tepidamorphus sp. 3E244]|uniref:bifunctional phosphopantothenoylcysteine decarboxylase/phosphopantothenate--cysteine ligase CoaBC n=1 Tax=Tepidamorphus sp. 3E244 TaxID=3385498 RepID=UPI0038FC8B63
MNLQSKRILLIVGGGIAAYKALELIRQLRKRGASVRVIMTSAAGEFVTPLSLSSLSGDKVYTDLFSLTDEAEMGHIELSRDADLLVVAPATANLLARMAAGIADELATTALLATDKPVLCAPAMNVRMWEHAATQRNAETLRADGVTFVGPDEGDMACGEYGPGRLAQPDAIVSAIETHFASASKVGSLAGRKLLITAGPTHEPIDPVRYIANRSSGKQGHAIAAAAVAAGAQVVLVTGPVALPDPAGVTTIHVESAREMLAAVEEALPADAAIFTAAVADWRPDAEGEQKIKKQAGSGPPQLALTENPDILASVAAGDKRPGLVVGFAAETENVIAHATAKRARKKADWIVANDVSPATGVMGGDTNTVHVVGADGVESWPQMSKREVAEKLVACIAEALETSPAESAAK